MKRAVEYSYAGGLDWVPAIEGLVSHVEQEGISDFETANEEQIEGVWRRVSSEITQWIDERKPYFDVRGLDLGTHDVTPDEEKEKGKWKYTITVDQGDKITYRREKVTQPVEEVVEEPQQQTRRQRVLKYVKELIIGPPIPPFDPERFAEELRDSLVGTEVEIELNEENPFVIIPDPLQLIFEGKRRVYKLVAIEPNEDRDTSGTFAKAKNSCSSKLIFQNYCVFFLTRGMRI